MGAGLQISPWKNSRILDETCEYKENDNFLLCPNWQEMQIEDSFFPYHKKKKKKEMLEMKSNIEYLQMDDQDTCAMPLTELDMGDVLEGRKEWRLLW